MVPPSHNSTASIDTSPRVARRLFAAAALGFILFATLTPQTPSPILGHDFFGIPPRGIAATDLLQNVILYAPLGLLLGWRRCTWQRAFIISALISLGTELCQYVIPGRVPSVIDVLTNVAGATAAWGLMTSTPLRSVVRTGELTVEQWLHVAVRPTRKEATWLSLAWAGVVAVVAAATFWLFSPAFPKPFYFLVSTPFIDDKDEPLRLGGDGDRRGFFTGLIDEVRIYSTARTAESIVADMGRPIAGSVAEPDLIAAYGFDSSDDTVTDASGRTAAGVRGATKWTPSGRFGGALVFDGSTEVEMPESPVFALRRAVTIEAWINPARRQTGHGSVVTKGGGAYFILTNDPLTHLPSAGGSFGADSRFVSHRRRLPADTWTHVAMTYDGQSITLFVNGRPAARLRQWSSHYPLSTSLNDVELSPGLVASPTQILLILSGPFSLRVSLTCGPLQKEVAPVFALLGVQSQPVLVVDASGADLILRPMQHARQLGLGAVPYTVPDVLEGCSPGQTRSFFVKGPMQDLRVEDANGHEMMRTGPGIGSAWAVFLNAGVLPVQLVAALSIGYLALLMVPFGFWARMALPSMIASALFVGILWVLPKIWPTAISGGDWAGMIAGAVLGVLLSRASAHEHRLDSLEHNKSIERQ